MPKQYTFAINERDKTNFVNDCTPDSSSDIRKEMNDGCETVSIVESGNNGGLFTERIIGI